MKELLDKLTSYNLFNNLLPGIIFCIIGQKITGYNLVLQDIIIGVFFYYFIGMVISRIGSLFVEPLFKRLKIVVFSSYSDFIIASKYDEKIELISESNNSFRSMISVFISLFILFFYYKLESNIPMLISYRFIVFGVSILVIFVLSYRKQTSYLRKRVEQTIKEHGNV